jgi:transmembrane sensor
MLDDTDLARIVRYILGECSPGEAADTQQWIAQDPARVRAVAALEQFWSKRPITPAPPVEEGAWDVDAAWSLFENASPRGADAPGRRAREHRPLQLVPLSAHTTTNRRWTRVAASIAAALVLSVLGSLFWQATTARDHAAELAATGADTAGMREFRTARAQRAEIRLTDGTLATLAPASRLRVAKDYGTGARDLYLEGEAYFEVRHDAAHPFRVYTSRGVTEDLGTKFAVRAYGEDSVVRVAVADGAVRLHAREVQASGARARATTASVQHHDSLTGMITAGHVGVLSPIGIPRVRAVADLTPYLAWAGGRLVFRDTPLRDVVTELSRWYGIDMRIADARIGRRVYTASFQDEPVSEVLRALEIALDVRAERHGNVVVLRARRSTAGL